MSSDWIVISRHEPTHKVLIAALLEVMPDASLRTTAEETVWEILLESTPVEQPAALLAVELPRRIQNPAEPHRLLAGSEVSAVQGTNTPLVLSDESGRVPAREAIWWQEIHALGDIQMTDPLADRLAHAVAARSEGAVVLPHRETA